jgi:hypothetical protein
MALPLFIIVGSLPLLAVFNNLAALGLLLIALAPTLILSVRGVPLGYLALFRSIARPLAAILVVPACYLLFQVLPLRAVAHPAWESAASALGISLRGAVSVDAGASILSFCKYCAFCGLVFGSFCVAMTRQNAEKLLLMTSLSITITLLVLPISHHGALIAIPGNVTRFPDNEDFGFVDSLAFIFAGSLLVELFERYWKKKDAASNSVIAWLILAVCVIVAILSLVRISSLIVILGSSAGLILLLFTALVRRFGVWVVGAPAITVLAVAITLASNGGLAHPDLDATLRFAGKSDLSSVQRMVEDAPIFGTGAGTFGELEQVYRPPEDSGGSARTAPLSAVMAVEIGRIFVWMTVAIAFGAMLFFLSRAVARGRSWIYPAVAASLICIALIFTFSTPFGENPISLMLGAVGIGLGVANSFSK